METTAESEKMEAVTRININVSSELHRRVKAAAALAGLSLADYLTEVLEGRLPPPGTVPEPQPRKGR
jgi:predicted DNA binding CopG/RHH family protein